MSDARSMARAADRSAAAPVIALFGPTAVGKTAVAIELADLLRARGDDPLAISADSMQIYEGLGVLTGAATAAERARLEHRLLGCLPVTQPFSVGQYMPLAHREIDAALAGGRRPIVVGGTGLYLRAAVTDLDLRPPPDPEIRERLQRRADEDGVEALRQEVLRNDPAARIAPGDRNRAIRYLELQQMRALPVAVGRSRSSPPDVTGTPPGERDSQLWAADTRHPTVLIGLVMDRAALSARIDARMDAIAASALDEVRAADAAGASHTARKALGFEELLNGDLEAMKVKARQFARRQMTWMRKMRGVRVVDATRREPADVARDVLALVDDPESARDGVPRE